MVQMQSDLPPPGTDNIREQHAWLFERFEAYRDKTPGDRALRSEILAQFDRLLENMKHFYRKVESAEEYNWLISATYQWQVAFTSVFQIPRNIREEIGIPLQFPDLEPVRRSSKATKSQSTYRARRTRSGSLAS